MFFRYLIAALLLIAFASLAIVSDKPAYRYHNLPCHFDAIYNTQGSVDYVVLGTSRTMQGIDPLTFSSNKDDVTVNLARNWRGPGQLYNILEDFSSQHTVEKGVIFEITYYNTRQYYGYFKEYGTAASWGQLVSDFNSKPREKLFTRLGDLASFSFSKLDKGLTNLVERRAVNNVRLTDPLPAATSRSCSKGDNNYNSKRLKRDMAKFVRLGGYERKKMLDWDINAINEDRNAFYVEKIIKYAEKNNIKPIFVTVPRYLMYPVGEETTSTFEAKFGYPLYTMPKEKLHELYKADGYSDPGHLKENGRKQFTEWLTSVSIGKRK